MHGIFYLYVCLWTICVPEDNEGQKTVLDPQELEVQLVVSSKWVLGKEPRSSGEASSALNQLFITKTFILKDKKQLDKSSS